ncbi:MAG: YggS family pyridoxal phosphate-dependent enzyme [Gemmatimonadota bacterium]
MSFQDLGARLAEVSDRVAAAVARGGHGQRVTVIAVTKTHGPDAVQAAWHSGIQNVGENKVQEALGKMGSVDVPVRWHLIGHLQRNKVRELDHFALVHSIDRASVADAVSAFGIARKRSVDGLVQVNVVGEQSKGGFAPENIPAESEQFITRAGLRITGVMTMAPLGADERTTRHVFQGARAARDVLVSAGHLAFDLSMGMSNDYELAVEEGATMIRLGTVLFGERGT